MKLYHSRIQQAAEKSGRSVDDVCLVAVTKTVGSERILELAGTGIVDIGENKVQEAESKRADLAQSHFKHHFLGHLQRNKARKAVELFDMIQSVDSDRLAEALDKAAAELGKKQDCLIEVKISDEPSKTGLALNEAPDFIKGFSRYQNLRLNGLMTIGPYGIGPDKTRALFKSFAQFFQQHRSSFGEKPVLSMGMSDDFEIAIEEGATMVRLGRALFGERKPQ